MKKYIMLALTLVMAVSATACGGGAETGTTATGSETAAEAEATTTGSETTAEAETDSAEAVDLEEVTVVLDWTPNTNHTGMYVAQELGYYAEEGLEVSIIQPPEGGAALLVASNKAEFGISSQDVEAPAFISDSPLPITSVATIIQHNTSGILSVKGNGIDTPKGMEDKTYATWDVPIEQAMVRALVASDGGDYDKIKMIPSTAADVMMALQTGTDSVWVYYAWDGIAAEVNEFETDYIDFGTLVPELDFYTPTILSSLSYLEENPEQAKAFLRATKLGYEYAIENPEAAAEILLKHAPELDEDLVVASQIWLADQYKAEVDQWGYMDVERWDNFYYWLEENELVDAPVTSGMGMTNEYLPE
ncbi:MAG: ABC transporter substrate-binding protein [Bacillota bacterium]